MPRKRQRNWSPAATGERPVQSPAATARIENGSMDCSIENGRYGAPARTACYGVPATNGGWRREDEGNGYFPATQRQLEPILTDQQEQLLGKFCNETDKAVQNFFDAAIQEKKADQAE